MASAIPAIPSPQLKTVLRWIDAFKNWNLDELVATMSDDYTHYIFPRSLNQPVRRKQEFAAYFQTLPRLFDSFNVTIEEIIECPGKVLIHASSVGMTTTGAPYANEYNLTFHLKSGDDPVIFCIKEFVDSKYSFDFFPAERARQAARRKHSKL